MGTCADCKYWRRQYGMVYDMHQEHDGLCMHPSDRITGLAVLDAHARPPRCIGYGTSKGDGCDQWDYGVLG